jgi:pilus assembly protein CpaC
MKSKRNLAEELKWQLTLVMVMAFLAAGVASGWADQPPAGMSLPVATSRVMDFQNVKRVAVSDPAVADYVVLSARQLMLTARAPGTTDLYVWDDKGEHRFRVAVTAVPSAMGEAVARIRKAIGRPEIRVEEYNGVILLEGEVESPLEA